MRVSSLYSQVAKELGVPESKVKEIYQAYWKFYLDKVRELPFKKDMTPDDFKGLKSGFHMQKIGKFYCDYTTYDRCMRYIDKRKNRKRDVEDNED